MIEIKVPKEIKTYKSKLFFNLSVRQFVCGGAAIAICVPLYIYGKKYISEDIVSWLIMIIGAPLMLTGFFRYNDMNFEELAKEWLEFYFVNNQRRKYEYEPIFMGMRREYMAEDLTEEKIARKASKKLRRKQRRKNKGSLADEKGKDKKLCLRGKQKKEKILKEN